MNRRAFALVAVSSSVAAVIGCDTDQKPSHTATLLNNSGVQDALKAVEDAIGTLEADVGEFEDGDNWREVVPNVQAAANDVRDAFERLRTELGAAG
jgi:mannose/fructose/N-acetylgalactosamine-specific phosphotransferase system component IIB